MRRRRTLALILFVPSLAAATEIDPQPLGDPHVEIAPVPLPARPDQRWERVGGGASVLPLPVFDAAAVEADGRLVVLGGVVHSLEATAAIQIHDPRHGWLPIGSQLDRARAGASATPLPCGAVAVLGGWQGRLGRDLEHHDTGEILRPLIAGSSRPLPPFGGSLEGHSATLDGDGGLIVVAGDLARRLDPRSRQWSEPLRLMEPRRHHAAIAQGGGVLLLGGSGGGDAGAIGPTRIERLRWDPLATRLRAECVGLSIPQPLSHAAVVATRERDRLLLAGGICIATGATSSRTWRIDLREGSIRSGPPLPDERGAAAIAIAEGAEGAVLLGGEWRRAAARGEADLALLLDLSAAEPAFRPLPPLPQAGSHRIAIARAGGDLEILGGYRFVPSAAASPEQPAGVAVAATHHRLAAPRLAADPHPGGD